LQGGPSCNNLVEQVSPIDSKSNRFWKSDKILKVEIFHFC
jgi:hypothetical protein